MRKPEYPEKTIDTSAGGLLVTDGIIRTVVMARHCSNILYLTFCYILIIVSVVKLINCYHIMLYQVHLTRKLIAYVVVNPNAMRSRPRLSRRQ